MTDGRLSRLGWTLTREGAKGCRVVADEWPMTLSASWVPACVQARHHFSPQNLSAAVCFCYSGRQHQFFDNVGRDIQATSLPTARTHRRRRLAPACLARPGGAPIRSAKPKNSTLHVLFHVVQSPRFLDSFEMAFNRTKSNSPTPACAGLRVSERRLQAQRCRHRFRHSLRSAAPP